MRKFPSLLVSILTLALAIVWVSCDSGTSLPTVSNQFAFVRPAGGGTGTAMSPAQRHYQAEHMRDLLQASKLQRSGTGLKPMAIVIAPGTDSVVLMSNDGTGENVISNQGGSFYSVHLGPDGKKGVATAVDSNGWVQVYYVDLTNTADPTVKQLTTDSEDHYSAQISWDGSKVVFNVDSTSWQLKIMSTSGGTETLIPTSFEPSYPTFTPSGQIVLENDDSDTIVVMNADGSGVKELTGGTTDTVAGGAYDWSPSVSPDGTTVVFERDADTGDYICSVPIGGGTVKQLTTTGYNYDPMFVNNKIIYISGSEGLSSIEVFSMNLDGTNQKQLTTNTVDEYFDALW